jgi:nitroreductase
MSTIMSNILNRRSIRGYTSREVDRNDIIQMLTAASWAPSGNNLQPWRFSVITNAELIKELSSLTIYYNWVQTSPCLIAVFLDTKAIDDKISNIYLKHVQAIGAAIQNMLLTAHELGLGTCWIGEILKNEDKVKELIGIPSELQLMAIISVGYPSKDSKSRRKDIFETIINWL